VRIVLALIVSCATLLRTAGAQAQDYLLPDAPGKAEVTGSCERCHGIITVIKYKRSPHQWAEEMQAMVGQGMAVSDQQKKLMLDYLNAHYGQATDYVPQPPALRGHGPGLALAMEAAEAAQEACRSRGLNVTTLVVDSADVPIVMLTGDGVSPITQADAAIKTATVLKYQQSSGEVMKRMSTDPVLVAEIKSNSQIGEVLSGGLPIIANGKELVGAIAVSGARGPASQDDVCAQAGVDRIAARVR
jgi:uncharacterized protein GlcG (DUF336 family)